MKRIVSIFIIVLTIANIFAPFSIGTENGVATIKKSVAEAADIDVSLLWKKSTEDTIDLEFDIVRYNLTENHGLTYVVSDKPGTSISQPMMAQIQAIIDFGAGTNGFPVTIFTLAGGATLVKSDAPQVGVNESGEIKQIPVHITGLTKSTTYYVSYFGYSGNKQSGTILQTDVEVRTSDKGELTPDKDHSILSRSVGEDGYMPACWKGFTNGFISVPGCIAQVLYTLFFQPTSALFGFAGKFFDFSFKYSVTDTSYRTSFVVEGWKVVRDFVNMFFIFVMLYIAFSTILQVHGFKTKEMIVNVVIIGLLMNFSLFTTQVIIDASNILARVFYNTSTITTGNAVKDANGNPVKDQAGNTQYANKLGANGELQLSAAIVNKVNPQRLILDAAKIGNIKDSGGQGGGTTTNANGISTWTFILVTILASVVNIAGMFVFLTTGIVFIGRVIGLWLAMIFAPLAFFSYTVPSMQSIDTIGWKNWWDNTLKLAFLAPIFIFFMYLIIKFLGTNFLEINGAGGPEFVIAILVPFAFIIILMNKAKSLAVKFSGDIGSAVVKAGNIAGGVAIGAGVGALAMAGRQTVGRVANKLNNKNWLNDAAAGKNGRVAQFFTKDIGLKKLANTTAKGSFDIRQSAVGNEFSKQSGMNLNKFTNVVGLDTKQGLGGYVGVQQRKVEKENKFGESLGYDHHKYEELGEEISEKEAALAKYKANKKIDHNSTEYKASVAEQENAIKATQKLQERVKTGRAMENALTVKRKSGKIYDIDKTDAAYQNAKKAAEKFPNNQAAQERFKKLQTYRDELGNIKKFGHATSIEGIRRGEQAGKEIVAGFLKGMLAGSVVPGVGTFTGGLIGAVREISMYSGTTNRKVGAKDDHKHETPQDKYTPPSSSGASHTDSHDSGHKDAGHGDASHGGH